MMFRILSILALLVGVFSSPHARAEEDPSTMLSDLPDTVIKRLQKPDRFMEATTGLIMGFGTGDKIDADGIYRFVQAERAATRALALRRMLAADLNDDLVVSEHELQILMAAASARSRGRLLLQFRAGDINRDKRLDFDEMRRRAQSQAMEKIGVEDVAELMDLLALDANGDGFVSLGEVVTTARDHGYDV